MAIAIIIAMRGKQVLVIAMGRYTADLQEHCHKLQ